MSPRSRIAAAIVAAGALAASAVVPQMTQARVRQKHHRSASVTHVLRGHKRAALRALAAGLTPPAGTILHERAMIATPGHAPQLFELWAQADAPQAYRVIKWGSEGSWNGSTFSRYEAQTNTITVSPPPSEPPSVRGRKPVDYAASLRALVQSGGARVLGTSTIDGVPAYELSVNGESVLPAGSTAYVAQSSFRPLLIDYNANGGETIRYESYEYLPATGANLALLDLVEQHPGARVVRESQ
jgi:hypothetical protein